MSRKRLVKCDKPVMIGGSLVIVDQCQHRGHTWRHDAWWHTPEARPGFDRYPEAQCPQKHLHRYVTHQAWFRACGLCGYQDIFARNAVAFRAETAYGNMVRPPGVVIYDAV